MLSILLDQKGVGFLQNSDTPNDLEDTRAKKKINTTQLQVISPFLGVYHTTVYFEWPVHELWYDE